MEDSQERLARVEDLYERGLYLQAYEQSSSLGELKSWRGVNGRVLAGRLAANLGHPQLGRVLFMKAWRECRTDPVAVYYYALALLERQGPYRTWRFLSAQGDLSGADPETRASWFGLHCRVLASMRDFDHAEACLERAVELAPNDPWLCVERSHLLSTEDRYEESLKAALRSLSMRPWYRPGVMAAAYALLEHGEYQGALELLREASRRLESMWVTSQLVHVLNELHLYEEAQREVERVAQLGPLLPKKGMEWLNGLRSDIAYHVGDLDAARKYAESAGTGFHQTIAERLRVAPESRRHVLLEVPFVRQHYMTCAPATLASIGPYWSMPVDHLQVAEAICYDGTADHSERQWAEANGWVARGFTVTWDAAVALLDRGIPFAMGTVQPTSAHLQAVIGYDSTRRSFIIRDPSRAGRVEYLADGFLQWYRATGPRGMALVPAGEAHRLEGLDLPETVLYDQLYRLKLALDVHDRDKAQRVYNKMALEHPGHAFTTRARWVLAAYDADPASVLECVDQLLALFPGDQSLELRKLECLRELARRSERVGLLERICARTDADPIFRNQYAEELREDARHWDQSEALARSVIRQRPSEVGAYLTLATLCSERRRFEEALELHRFAACLAPMNERVHQAYANAARILKRSDEVLGFLQQRVARLGHKSSWPGRTLFIALAELGRVHEGFGVLDSTLQQHPDDPELLLFTAEQASRYGDHARGSSLLEQAEGCSRRNTWLRTAASLALARGDMEQARKYWGRVTEIEPLAVDARQAVASLLAQTESAAAARGYLNEVAARVPQHLGIQQLRVQWLRAGGEGGAEQALRELLAHHPTNAWARREYSLCLAEQQRYAEARQQAEEALKLDPGSPSSHTVYGAVCQAEDDRPEARRAFRRAIELAVDEGAAIHRLMSTCETAEERVEALALVKQQLEEQVVFGEGLGVYREVARAVLPPEHVLALMRDALAVRPDLPRAWHEITHQLVEMDRLEEAREIVERSLVRFPLEPQLWADLAAVEQARSNGLGRVAALERAVAISPTWAWATRELTAAYQDAGELEKAVGVMEGAIVRNPRDPYNRGFLAHALWAQGSHEAALEQLQAALRLDPTYEWAWDRLREWCRQLGRGDATGQLLAELRHTHAGAAGTWLALAREPGEPDEIDQRLEMLDRALALQPGLIEACDLRATLLVEAGRFDEALAACSPPSLESNPPFTLRGRAAWIYAQHGDQQQAIELMREVLALHPSYYWGWMQLAQWQGEAGDQGAAEQAAEMMVRLQPARAEAWGYLGDARLASGRRDEAKSAFQRAINLSPEYVWAEIHLFDLQLEDGDLAAAARTAQDLQTHFGGEYVLTRQIQLAVRQGSREAAGEHFRELCAVPSDEDWPLDAATAALRQAEWHGVIEKVVDEHVREPEPMPRVVARWVRLCVEKERWDECEQRLAGWQDREEVGVPAIASYVQAMAEQGHDARLTQFAERHAETLRRETDLWGMYGYALATLGEPIKCVQWLADWRERPDVRSYMLWSLVICLRHIDRWKEAREVGVHAQSLGESDCAVDHSLWLALDDALAGDARADECLAAIDPASLNDYLRRLYELADIVRSVERTEPDRRAEAFRAARGRLRATLGGLPDPSGGNGLILAGTQCARRLAQVRGGVIARVWALVYAARLSRKLRPSR